MRLHRSDQKLVCIVLGVLVGWLIILRLAQLPNVMPAYGGVYVLALVASVAFVATLRSGRTPASGPPWSLPRPWAVPSRQRDGETPRVQSVGQNYRRRDAIGAYACWEACYLALVALSSQLPWITWIYNVLGVPPGQAKPAVHVGLILSLLVSAVPSVVSVYVYDRLVRRIRFPSDAQDPVRLLVITALIWMISFVVLYEVSYQTQLYYKINQLMWDVFGPPADLYSFYNLSLPHLLVHVGAVAIPSWWLTMIAYRRIHRRVQSDQPVCLYCGYNLTGNVSGRCPECGKEILVERTGT